MPEKKIDTAPYNLADALNDEIERCILLKKAYADIGSNGSVGLCILSAAIDRAKWARSSFEVVEMLYALHELKKHR